VLQTTNPRLPPRGAAKAEVVRKSAAVKSVSVRLRPRAPLFVSPDPELHAYVVGLVIGDGNLSNPNGRAVRLRITCDTKYPRLIAKIRCAVERLLPQNKVSVVGSSGNYVNVSVYSNRLEALLGWRALGGSKQRQDVRVPKWICDDPLLSIHCLRGLIETDGAIYLDRGYQMVIFSTVMPGLARQVDAMMRSLGFRPRSYRVRQRPGQDTFKYQVRLSRQVRAFLDLVQPLKGQSLQPLRGDRVDPATFS
jgi:LAGLIDADG DNA endonuclease family protein